MKRSIFSKDTGVTSRLCMLVTCILMIAAIAITRHGRFCGYELVKSSVEDTATISLSGNNETVVNATNLARDVIGYGGPIPLKLYVKDGKIDHIDLLENAETPSFLERVKEGVIAKYINKTPTEARSMKVDAVSGATLSSKAVIETIGRSLDALSRHEEALSHPSFADTFSLISILALLTTLGMAVLPLFVKNKRYRTIQLLCNVVCLGFLSGTFVSYSSTVGFLANGFTGSDLALIVLLITAFLYPLIGKPGYYCAWGCPLGSAQELIGGLNKRKLIIPLQWQHRLNWFRRILWGILMLMSWSGILLEWMDYELFTAFVWQSASWVVIVLAVLFALLSLFVNRPYCRFVCPTGTLLKTL